MKLIKNLIPVFLLTAISLSCDDPYNDQLGDVDYINNDGSQGTGELDHWLNENFTSPYNIQVKYRWDASEVDLFRTVVPPKVEQVQNVMEVVKKVWIDTYSELAGADFIKKYCPKQFVLVGSARYNLDGTVTLGTAEGGRKVVLYVVNDFEKNDEYKVKKMMHTIEHEFAHVLHQTISYPATFKEITPGNYTANWNMVPLSQARASGFITSYAMASPDEDFAEMVSMMLIEGNEAYNRILSCETSAAGYGAIKEKEKIVVEYFKKYYGIDFYALQTKVQEAITELAPGQGGGGNQPPAPIQELWGLNKQYTALRFDLTTLAEPGGFMNRFIYDNNLLHNAGYALDYTFELYFYEEDLLYLSLHYHTINNASDRKDFTANFVYRKGYDDSSNTYGYGLLNMDENAHFITEEIGAVAMASYFNNNFYEEWVEACNGDFYVGLYPYETPYDYCLGFLGN